MYIEMRNTIKSYLASKKEDCIRQIEMLDKHVLSRKNMKKEVIRFVMYWGVSDKEHLDKNDFDTLIFLFGFLRIIEKHYKMNVDLTIVFTDTHAFLNGYYSRKYNSYIKEIRGSLNSFNYNHLLMSEVLIPYVKQHNYKDIDEFIYSIIDDSKHYGISEYLNENSTFTNHLINSAGKYCRRYTQYKEFKETGFEDVKQAAYAYIQLNQIEKVYLEKNFFQSVFLTYTSKDEKEFIAPDLPTMQLFSTGKNESKRPWFSHYKNKR